MTERAGRSSIRVALVQMPPRLRSAVTSMLGDAQDVEITSSPDSAIEAMLGARSRDFDAAIAPMGEGVPAVATSMVTVNASLKVLLLRQEAEGDELAAYLFDLRPDLVPLGGVDGPALAHAIRVAVWPEVA